MTADVNGPNRLFYRLFALRDALCGIMRRCITGRLASLICRELSLRFERSDEI